MGDIFENMSPEFRKAMEEQEKLSNERSKTVRSGPNVLHLHYFGEVDDSELKDIEAILSGVGLQLSSYNQSGIIQASFPTFLSYVVIAQPLLIELLKGVASNAVWDSVKLSISKIWNAVYRRKMLRASGKEFDNYFGAQFRVGKTLIDVELQGDVTEDAQNEILDKMLKTLQNMNIPKDETPVISQSISHYKVQYLQETGEWVAIDVLEEIRRKMSEQKQSDINQ